LPKLKRRPYFWCVMFSWVLISKCTLNSSVNKTNFRKCLKILRQENKYYGARSWELGQEEKKKIKQITLTICAPNALTILQILTFESLPLSDNTSFLGLWVSGLRILTRKFKNPFLFPSYLKETEILRPQTLLLKTF
jgi:hypothetical protein